MFELSISEVESSDDEREVLALLRDYFLWLRRRYVAQADVFDARFDANVHKAELVDLRGDYAMQRGAILIAHVDGAAAGCAMLRPLSDGASEMRRLFVRPAFQRHGIGRALVSKLATIATALGHRSIRVETGPRQFEAMALYREIGFKRVAPYKDVASWFADNMLYLEADLSEVMCRAARPKAAALSRAA